MFEHIGSDVQMSTYVKCLVFLMDALHPALSLWSFLYIYYAFKDLFLLHISSVIAQPNSSKKNPLILITGRKWNSVTKLDKQKQSASLFKQCLLPNTYLTLHIWLCMCFWKCVFFFTWTGILSLMYYGTRWMLGV